MDSPTVSFTLSLVAAYIFGVSEDDIVCLEDLTVIDEFEETIMESSQSGNVLENLLDGEIPATEDSLSKGTIQSYRKVSRYWETLQASPKSSLEKQSEIRVCSYNVLCQQTTTKTMYLYGHLKWIRCLLQETYWGCKGWLCSFYQKTKFEVVSYRIVEYFVAPNTSMDRDQIGQIIRVRCKTTRQELIIANTHLIFNTGRGDIKIGQLAILLANIYEVMMSSSSCPLIMTGDFNMEPLSYVYTYLSESRYLVPYLHFILTIERIVLVFIVPRPSVPSDYFTHPLILTSVYHHKNSKGKIEISTYHKDAANPDFIFYSIQQKSRNDQDTKVYELPNLQLLRRMSLPDLDILQSTLGPWPNKLVPSDHIPLVADFLITGGKNNSTMR
uniref:Endo/exonuclease/phosphatase domain-containing protein n=1 Tax=Heterorhabditis bacteriophora TaxID=37862 RepID=A0A1I7XM84_HETBA